MSLIFYVKEMLNIIIKQKGNLNAQNFINAYIYL